MEKSEEKIFPNAYCVFERKRTDMVVLEKIRTDVYGHLTYVLIGVSENGTRFSTLVNKSQWDRYDVPVTEKKVEGKKHNDIRRKKRIKMLRPTKKTPLPQKSRRKVINVEIERWLAEHYDIDFDSMDGLDGPITDSQ